MAKKLYAVTLGGRAAKCNIELHDVVFAVADSVKASYPQLLDKWFGEPDGLHIDSWIELSVVDGYRVSLEPGLSNDSGMKLYFLNLGAYHPGQFAEAHINGFVVAANVNEAKRRAKETFFTPEAVQVHTDYLYDVDDCIELAGVDGYRITLTQTGEASTLEPHNSYQPLPKDVVAAWVAGKK